VRPTAVLHRTAHEPQDVGHLFEAQGTKRHRGFRGGSSVNAGVDHAPQSDKRRTERP
jgi:hypothetical protein